MKRGLSWLVLGLVGMTSACAVGAVRSQQADMGATEAERAQVPLAEIAGAEAPPPVTVGPLDQVPDVQAAVEQARSWIEDGHFGDAVEVLTATLQKTGGDRCEVHYLLALAKTRLGQFDAARTSAEAAARLGHGNADIHCLLAQIYRGRGETEAAIAHYRSATLAADRELNNPKVTRAWYSLGQLLEQTGYDLAAAEAYAHFDTALWETHTEQRNAPEFAALLGQHPYGMVPKRLQLLKRVARHDDALRAAEWARAVWPDDLSIDRLYAEALISAGQPERAFNFCHERLDDRQAAEALLPIAVEAARAADRLPGWLDEVIVGIAQGAGLEQARTLIRLLRDAGESAQAVRVGQALLARGSADADMAWEVAAAQRMAGDLGGALETLVTFVRGSPDLVELSPPRLAAWRDWFEPGANLSDLVKALRARPDADFATDFVLGVSALVADQPALADELLRSCVASRPDFAPAYLARGEMLLASYQWDAARQYAEGLLETHPELVAAHYLLARAHEGLDENEQAEREYKQAIKLRPEEPTYSLSLAQHYRRLDNLRGAQRYFQQVLADAPGNGEALEGLIDCYLRGGKIEIARVQLDGLDRAVVPADSLRRIDTLMRFVSDPFGQEHLAELRLQFERYPDDLATARMLAGGLHYRGRLDEAREVIEKVLAKFPEDYHLTVLLANVHSLRGEFDQAVALLAPLAQRFPNRLAVLQPLTLAELNDFRLEEGRARLLRLAELDPDGADRYHGELLASYIELGDCDEPLRLLDEWRQADLENEAQAHQRIEVLISCGRYEEAFALVEQRLKERPTDPARVGEYVEYGERAKQYDAVADRLREWWKGSPGEAKLAEELITVLILAQRPDEALEVARKFEGTYAESFQRRIWLGRCQAARNEIDAAVAEFEALLSERGVDSEVRRKAREQIFLTLHDAGRYDEMLARCEKWLQEPEGPERAPTPEVLLYKRFVLQSAGRDAECAEAMEALLPYSSSDVGILNDLGYTWVDLGVNLERATTMIKAAVAAEPWNAAFLDSLGWAHYKAGDFSNARKYLGRAVQLRDGQDAVVYDHLADAAFRLNDRETAREYWNKASGLLQTELAEREQARLTDLLAVVRVKLAALERSETPTVAPTAAEQHTGQDEE